MMQRKKGLRMKELQPSFTSTSRLRVADYVLSECPRNIATMPLCCACDQAPVLCSGFGSQHHASALEILRRGLRLRTETPAIVGVALEAPSFSYEA
jgi:hypothetical protein